MQYSELTSGRIVKYIGPTKLIPNAKINTEERELTTGTDWKVLEMEESRNHRAIYLQRNDQLLETCLLTYGEWKDEETFGEDFKLPEEK